MATIGKSRAVVELGRLRFGGLLAWFAWLALHVTVLIGFRNRISVLLSWIYSYIFFRRGSRLITGLSSEHIAQLSSDAIGGATLAPAGAATPGVPMAAKIQPTQSSSVSASSPPGTSAAADVSDSRESLPPRG
jgi:NADH dehydrogenase